MLSVTDQLSQRVGEAFESLGLPKELGRTVLSDRPDLAPYQCNGALSAAQKAGRAPRDIAHKLAEHLQTAPELENVEIAGPGFLNLTPKNSLYNQTLEAFYQDERAGTSQQTPPRTVLIDFGGPNIAKPLHVGHLRASILGDCLQRLFRYRGDRVISDVHLGDWGLQMGQVIDAFRHKYPDWPYFDPKAQTWPDEPDTSLDELEALYPEAVLACRQDPKRLEDARAATLKLQKGDKGYHALWQGLVNLSTESIKKDFKDLGVHFDLWKGESDVDHLIPEMVTDLKQKNIVEKDQGALIIRVSRAGDKREIPPFLLLKSDGGVLYETTDLATIADRRQNFNPDLTLYVVDQRQNEHFTKVFRASERAGYTFEGQLDFIGFGTMNGPDGRPFKTRAGGVLKLSDLITLVTEKAEARLEDAGLAQNISSGERRTIARSVGLAALKFADLSNNRTTNYIFDVDRFTSFEGKTGPYLLYAAVRIKSLLRKACKKHKNKEIIIEGQETKFIISTPEEQALARVLDGFDEVLKETYKKYTPHILCDHIYMLAQAFSSFYAACPVLAETVSPAVRTSRLSLIHLVLRHLEIGFEILGFEVPEHM